MIQQSVWRELKQELEPRKVTLVAVSKTKPVQDIEALYQAGQRDFGENYVQELVDKQAVLPGDIRWHFIGHLQSNKVKLIVPFVHLVHGVDSFRLMREISRQSEIYGKVTDVLLQIRIATEETKYGLTETALTALMEEQEQVRLEGVRIRGVMGMASFTEDGDQVRREFAALRNVFVYLKQTYMLGEDYFDTCSMGMSGDYAIAVEEGSTMVRIGSMLFGLREKL